MKQKIKYHISKIVLIFILMIGILVIATTFHELKHVYDIKDDSEITDICVWNVPTNLKDFITFNYMSGYVKYIPSETTYSSEVGATFISTFLIISLGLICFYYFEKRSYLNVKEESGENKK